MKKRDIVKSNILFNDIINNGVQNNNRYFILCRSKVDDNTKKFGIAVGKKIGNAVVRNKIKRQLRNIVDENLNVFPNGYNYIIICKKEILELSFKEMNDYLIKLI